MEFPGISFDLSSLEKSREPDPVETYDLLILGGGPAALSAAVYAARKMMKSALITTDIGGQMADTSEIGNYMGFQTISGSELIDKFNEQVRHFDIPIGLGNKVVEVRKKEDLFEVEVEDGAVFLGRTVIMATGKRSRSLNVPGEKELTGKGVAYCAICDAPFFKDKRVVVAGGGNSAFTAALDLLKVAREVTIVNYAAGWQADQIMIQSAKKYDTVNFFDQHEVTRIDGEDRVTAVHIRDNQTGEDKTISADGIFIEIGLIPNSESVRNLVQMTEANEVIVDCRCNTNVEGLFGAGDVTTVPYKQIVISAGEGAKAALAAHDYLTKRGLL